MGSSAESPADRSKGGEEQELNTREAVDGKSEKTQ
jgi:hypothetical protein